MKRDDESFVDGINKISKRQTIRERRSPTVTRRSPRVTIREIMKRDDVSFVDGIRESPVTIREIPRVVSWRSCTLEEDYSVSHFVAIDVLLECLEHCVAVC